MAWYSVLNPEDWGVPQHQDEIKAIIKRWEQYAHPRAYEFFASPGSVEEVLTQLAKGVDAHDDPVIGPEDKCVYWFGNVTKGDFYPALHIIKPGEAHESVTFVNRVLAFLFAKDESYEQLMKLPKEPFRMSCKEHLCV